jgi:translocation and assembly module TamA
VKPGRRWKFGPVDVAAGRQLPRDRILGQALAVIHPGDWFDESKLDVARARVFELGAFAGVRVTRLAPDEARGTIGILIVIQRAPFRTIRAGPGLGVEVIRWDAHALVGWQDRNFFGDLRRLDTELRAGYAWLPNPWTPTKRGTVGIATGDFTQPAAFGSWVDATVRLETEKGIEPAYDYYAERTKVGLPLRIAPRWRLVPSYNLEVYELSNYQLAVISGTQTTSSGASIENCKGNVCLLSYLEQVIAWDGRDDPLNTRRGLFVGISLQEGIDIATYGYRYFRFLPEARVFVPLGGRTVLAVRGRLGALVPISESGAPPIVARFFAGGPLSMRGYYNRRLSPMQRQGFTWVPVGGNGLVDGSVELRFGVAGNFGMAVFVDFGAVSNASGLPNEWQKTMSSPQWAAGVGLRYRTPFGPLRADFAVRLPDRWSTASDAFPSVPFTAYPDGAPHREPILAVHISLGEAF